MKNLVSDESRYQLFYWPTIQGRGEFIRLALEQAGASYIDVARRAESSGLGLPALLRCLDAEAQSHPPFAPPFLKIGNQLIAQSANILLFLGPRLKLVPKAEETRLWAHQLQLTIADLVNEIHDSHHPIAGSLYYRNQKAEARRRAADLITTRLPKFFSYFERVLTVNPQGSKYLVDDALSYVDLSLFQIIAGLRYAYPNALRSLEPLCQRCITLYEMVQREPRIKTYLKSRRRLPFNQGGIFRHYPELDLA
ncbi:MAG: glutathione S-transferase [Herbaspirillum sp.]